MNNVLQNVPLSPSAPVPLSSIIGYKTTLIPNELMEAGKKTINDIIRKYGRDPEDFTVEKVFTLCTDRVRTSDDAVGGFHDVLTACPVEIRV